MRYRWDLLPALAGRLAAGRPEAALASLDELVAELHATTPRGLTLFKLRCAQCMSTWARGARAGGADSDTLLDDHLEALASLAAARSLVAIHALLRAYLRQLARSVAAARGSPAERVVAEIRADLKASLASPRTLPHYARAVGLSVGHLSRLFSRVAGESFSAARERLRHQEVLRLIRDTALPVGDIARGVGVRSASQLIAAFRRRTGTTPGRLRRSAYPR